MTGKQRMGIAGVGLMGHGICHQLLEKDYVVSVLGHNSVIAPGIKLSRMIASSQGENDEKNPCDDHRQR